MLGLCLLFFITLSLAQDNYSVPTSTYLSRPDLLVPAFNITTYVEGSVTPGYIFMAPYQSEQPGPYIYDDKGNLVWSGYSSTGGGNAHNFRVCQYHGSPHLCYFQGNQQNGFGRGQAVIMDNSYRVVQSVQSVSHIPNDMHEFSTTEDGRTALVSAYLPMRYDLSVYGITNGQGWLMAGIAQEIDIPTGDLIFEWNSIDYVLPTDSFVAPNSTEVAGTGLSPDSPWDYFHLNAIDKNSAGDYLVSARHVSAIYKISGADGSVIWQLGGIRSDFVLDDFDFDYQHDARFMSENDSVTVISLFDNGANGFDQTSNYSAGKIVAINHSTKTASLVQEYAAPDASSGLLSSSQGNLQFLDNGNVFIGWGSNAYISEHTNEGDLVFFADYANSSVMSYRVFKFNWTSYPPDSPAVYAYAHNTSAETSISVSWNGATEVAQWTYYGGDDEVSEMSNLATVDTAGFETTFISAQYHAFVAVEALASNGTVLGNSTISTFVPGVSLARSCNNVQCPLVSAYNGTPMALADSSGNLKTAFKHSEGIVGKSIPVVQIMFSTLAVLAGVIFMTL